MKQASKPTRRQKEYIFKNKLNPFEWMVVEEQHSYLKIINRETDKIKVINKYKGENR